MTESTPAIGHNQPPPLAAVLAENYAGLAAEVEALADRANTTPREVKTEEDLGPVGELVTSAGALYRRIDDARKTEKEPHLTASREIDAFFRSLGDRADRIKEAFTEAASAFHRAKAAEERRAREEVLRKAREEEERQREIARRAEEAGRQAAASKAEAKADDAADRAAAAESAAKASGAELAGKTVTSAGITAAAKGVLTFEITDYDAIDLAKLRPYLPRTEVEKAIRSYLKVHKTAAAISGVRFFEDVKATFR